MNPLFAFMLGGGVALAFKDRLRGAGKNVVVGAMRAKRGVAKVFADARETLQDIEAEVEHRDQARAAARPSDTTVS
jgi:hypothetical protein